MGDENASFVGEPNNIPEEDNNYYNMTDVIWYRPGAEASSNTPFRIAQLTFKNTANGTLTYTYADPTKDDYQLYELDIENGVIKYNY